MSAVIAPTSLYAPVAGTVARVDLELVAIIAALLTIGIVMVASASVGFADSVYGDPWFFVKRHAIYLLLGGLGGALVAAVPPVVWRDYGWVLLLLALLLLVLVLVPGLGRRVNGSQRWLIFGPITVQASEVAKFSAVVFFAGYLARRQLELRGGWSGIVKPTLLVAVIVFLLLLEPDFGSAVVICATVVAMMFLAGVKMWQFGLLTLLGGCGLALIAILSPYRMQRLITFLDPWADQFNSGYQLTQSLIAFGRGEWLGVGLGNSVQKLFYLPEAHTDFIFAIVAEEFGLIGCTLLIGLFVGLVFKVLDIARRAIVAGDAFASFAAFGIAILIGGQTFINIGVASGLLPTKGLTLPFISYGGSSLIVCCALMAFLLRLDWELRRPAPVAEKKQRGRRRAS
ncbi:putative lipid II flippase FtsW [Exilibacterium tricleocarpae]|uniref:Probable peptidoglycan glycosyltransferase FtsW n=1 Tax=Exilibacterium tricleocarpae TaxID=2591008 RepID=A0A545TQC6_9GAMM|nr:putative lipid II flippase FtsW [Exilibacterium tricleocarpae]TQV79424.1 putative lipid II flippase FtsW [Exilibacterium tricleocarpae]